MVAEFGGINNIHYRLVLVYNIDSLGTLLKGMLGALDTLVSTGLVKLLLVSKNIFIICQNELLY